MNTKTTDIFFDLDHTLWDFDKNSKNAFEKLLKENNLPVSIENFLTIYEPINKKYWEEYSQGIKTKAEVKFRRLTDTFDVLNIKVNQKFIEYFADAYLNYLKEEKQLMPGTIEILEYLQNKYRLHILTNGFIEIQERKVHNSGLNKYFKSIISSEEINKQKPHPEVFNYALQKAGTYAHKSIMIGDNLKSDVLGARNVGMQAIHYDPFNINTIDKKIIPKVNHLLELKEIL